MPSLLVPRSDSNWGVPPDILVTPKTNIIMNKIYIQTYNGDTGNIDYRLRIRDELTSQIIYDVSNITSNTINNTVGTEIWRDFKDVKMISGRTYRLNITTSHKDGNGVWGDTTAFRGASNTDLSISSDSTRMFGVTSGGNFPEIRFDYTVDDSGIFVRGTSSAKETKTIARPAGVQEGDILVLHMKHYSDASVVSDNVNGFSLVYKSEYSTMMYRVATKNEPSSYQIGISTSSSSWIEMQLVVVANAEVVGWDQILGGNDATATINRSKNFAVVGGISNAVNTDSRSRVLNPFTSAFTYSMISIMPANTNVVVTASFWDSKTKYLILEAKSSTPPTKPSSFTKQPIVNSINLSGESVSLEWGVSTSASGGIISYSLELFNGTAWDVLSSDIKTNSYTFVLSKLNTDKAQFRVKAIDSKGGQSEYTLGNVFTIATRLLLIQDNNIVKSFKDGIWKPI
ncbi:hypothetical protein [Bacillus mobilis]|uniref:hypothetical protein n=1 Tax=Bacillus mobilis TaxID=2026190 RepID=UPI00368DCE22